MKRALFIGHYPNIIEPYLRSFFQVLIHSVADTGIECTVIAPVSVTHYNKNIFCIPKKTIDTTLNGARIKVYHPRHITYSSKKIGKINTGIFSEQSFQKAALKYAIKLKDEFDFVYGHFFLTGGLAAVRIGRKLNIPSFIAYGECDYQSQIFNDYGPIKRCELRGLTGVVSVSTKNTNELKELGIVDNVPVLTVPNATDLNLFCQKDKSLCRRKLGLPMNAFIVGFVGGFIERKGDKRLLEAVNQLDDVFVAFAGRGDNPPEGDKVVFCKPLEHEVVCDFLNAIDVFCLPTLSEGSCNAIVEAMACGVPIISSDLPFNEDVLNDRNSVLINPNSVVEIREAIKKLYLDRNELARLSKESLNTAENLSINVRTSRIISFIENHLRKG